MKVISAKWFECSVRYVKQCDNGTEKRVTEIYVVDAMTFTEAEARIIEEMSEIVSGEFDVVSIRPAQYREIAFMTDGEAILHNETNKLLHACNVGKGQEQYDADIDFNRANVDSHFYKVKVAFITIDERTGKDKLTNVQMLVEGCCLHDASTGIDDIFKGSMSDFTAMSVVSTRIVDVITKPAE